MEDLNSLVVTLNAEINNDMNSKELDRLWEEDPTEAAKLIVEFRKEKYDIRSTAKTERASTSSVSGNIKKKNKEKLHLKHPEIADPIKVLTVKSNIMNYQVLKDFQMKMSQEFMTQDILM